MMNKEEPSHTPLDYEMPAKREEVLQMHKGYWLLLEFVPIGLLAISLILHETAWPLERFFLILGGVTAGLIYLVYNLYLFFRRIIFLPEFIFSGLGAMVLFVGLLGIWWFDQGGDGGFTVALYAMYGGVLVTGLAILFFALNLFEFGKFTYYRTLITRNLVFVAILYRLLMGGF